MRGINFVLIRYDSMLIFLSGSRPLLEVVDIWNLPITDAGRCLSNAKSNSWPNNCFSTTKQYMYISYIKQQIAWPWSLRKDQENLYLHSPSDVKVSFFEVILLIISNNSEVFSREQNRMIVKSKGWSQIGYRMIVKVYLSLLPKSI